MDTSPPDREAAMEWTAVSKKRRVGQPVIGANIESMESNVKDPCRKFSIELGAYRTEPEVLAHLHLKYPWVKLVRRNGLSGRAQLFTKDERSRALLSDIKSLNGKSVSFRPLESGPRRTYIMMRVPSCVTPQLLLQDDLVLEAERMTRWDTVAKVAVPTDMMKVTLSGKQHPERFSRGYGSYRMRPFIKAPQQCHNCQKFGHVARACWKDSQTCRYCAGGHPSSQCKGNQSIALKCANCGEGHATTSRACPKKAAAIQKSKIAQKVVRAKEPSVPIPREPSIQTPKAPSTPDPQCVGQEVCTHPRGFPPIPSGEGNICSPKTQAHCAGGETSDFKGETGVRQNGSSWYHTQSDHGFGKNAPETYNTQCTTGGKSAKWSRTTETCTNIAPTGYRAGMHYDSPEWGISTVEKYNKRTQSSHPSTKEDSGRSARGHQYASCVNSVCPSVKGPFQGHTSPDLLTDNASVCYPNCPFQGTLNSVPTKTITYQHSSAPSVATNVYHSQDQQGISTDPSVCSPNCSSQDSITIGLNVKGPFQGHSSQDQQTDNSSVCYPNCPFQGTLNNVPTKTITYQHSSAPTVATNVHHSQDQQGISTDPSVCSPNCSSQDSITIGLNVKGPFQGHSSQDQQTDNSSVCLPKLPFSVRTEQCSYKNNNIST